MAPIKRTPIRKARTKPRPGRLKGKDMDDLRRACLERDNYKCQYEMTGYHIANGRYTAETYTYKCSAVVSDDVPDWHPQKAHMAHIRNRRMWGDNLDNVSTRCKFHHIDVEHAYGPSGLKPVTPKMPGK